MPSKLWTVENLIEVLQEMPPSARIRIRVGDMPLDQPSTTNFTVLLGMPRDDEAERTVHIRCEDERALEK